MLIIKVQKGNITRALKQFKRKFRDTKMIKEIREREYYTKPSLKRRREMDEAIRRHKKQQNDE
jgi:small subunit ribosomal protein S21|tara:strand:- start:489 stop:677 length:189 start_codon:yes stop_codon:yes gene_type:complete